MSFIKTGASSATQHRLVAEKGSQFDMKNMADG
jgi:hypothetical protein